MLSRLAGDKIDLDLHIDGNLGSVRADSSQLEQVMMNLVVNAKEAMATNGRIVIRADSKASSRFNSPGIGSTPSESSSMKIASLSAFKACPFFAPFTAHKARHSLHQAAAGCVRGRRSDKIWYLSIECLLDIVSHLRVTLFSMDFFGDVFGGSLGSVTYSETKGRDPR